MMVYFFFGDSIPIYKQLRIFYLLVERTTPFDLNGIRVFGNGDLDDGIVLINDMPLILLLI